MFKLFEHALLNYEINNSKFAYYYFTSSQTPNISYLHVIETKILEIERHGLKKLRQITTINLAKKPVKNKITIL